MGKILIVAEKPSVGKDIAKVLKCAQKGDGFLFSEAHIISWAIGHLVTLFDPEDYDIALKSWAKTALPIIPPEIRLKPVESTKKQLNILKSLFNSTEVESIICATDSGREGELIFRYIYAILKCKKPFQRLWISSMTDAAIKDGFKKLKNSEEYDNLYYSAKCRSESDWLVGINATRAFTVKYGALLSVGRVQTPTLAILVNRQKEITSFVPVEYFEVKAFFGDYKGVWFDKESTETKIEKKDIAEEIKKKVKGQIGSVESIETEEKRIPPPLLYDLTELQRECNKKFGFSAKKTLEVAQDLYEKRKLITYPRTDSRYLSDDMIPKITTTLKKLATTKYREYAEYVLNLPKLPITKRIVDNAKITDHHAIIPTEQTANFMTLSVDEQKVYDAITIRFLSIFYPHYVYDLTKIVTNILDERFLTKGTTIKALGYMELYKNEKQDKSEKVDDESEILPTVSVSDERTAEKVDVIQKKTSAPKAYTEASLLSAMENAGRFVEDEALKEQMKDAGLGTPATRAAIIERLLYVGYIERKGKTVVPTEKGMMLIEVVPNELKSPETTGKWEKGLVSIAKGTMEEKRFMGSITKYVHYIVDTVRKSAVSVNFPKEDRFGGKTNVNAIAKCPSCKNGDILENTKSFYCSQWRNNCKFSLWKDKVVIKGDETVLQAATKAINEMNERNAKAESAKTENVKTESMEAKNATRT